MSNLTTLPKGDSAWLFRNAIERIIQQISDLETNIGSSTTGNSANTQIIFNDNGVLRGDPDLTFNTALNKLVATALESTTSLVVGTSATITGNLTVDTNTLFVDAATNRVCVGTTTPGIGNNASTAFSVAGGVATYSSFRASGGEEINLFASSGITGLWAFTNTPLTFGSNNTERYRIAADGVATWSNVGGVAGTAMTLNATGLGVGVASPATKLDVRGATNANQATFSGTAGRGLLISTRSDSLADDRTVVLSAQYATGSLGQLVIQTAGTDRLLVDNAGNVGIGVTPSAWASNRKALQVGGLAAASLALNGTSNVSEMFFNSFINTSASNVYAVNGRAGLIDFGSGGFGFSIDSGTQTAGAACNFTRAMTLDASGNLLVGKTSAIATAVGVQFQPAGTSYHTLAASTNSDTTLLVYSTGAAAYRFYVGLGGTVYATNTTISAISDARLKENVQDIDVGLGAILALKPRKFDWKAGKGKDIKGDRGFIAQEFEEVFPNLIDEWKDPAPEGEAPYKSVRQDLIPVLVKAIQELTARVQTLETR